MDVITKSMSSSPSISAAAAEPQYPPEMMPSPSQEEENPFGLSQGLDEPVDPATSGLADASMKKSGATVGSEEFPSVQDAASLKSKRQRPSTQRIAKLPAQKSSTAIPTTNSFTGLVVSESPIEPVDDI